MTRMRKRATNRHAIRTWLRTSHRSAQMLGGCSYAVSLLLVILITVSAWSLWPTVAKLIKTWQGNDDYSAGQLVPLVAGILVWHDRHSLYRCLRVPCWWAGTGVLVAGEIVRIAGHVSIVRPSVEQYGSVITLSGLILLVMGWQVFRQVVWILAFLLLMIPLPGMLHNLISGPLQIVATTGSVVLLEAMGIDVSQQGNIVMLGEDTPMAVAEACSGLRMLMAFVIVAAFIAYMVRRPRWQKAVLLVVEHSRGGGLQYRADLRDRRAHAARQ